MDCKVDMEPDMAQGRAVPEDMAVQVRIAAVRMARMEQDMARLRRFGKVRTEQDMIW